MNRLFPLLLLSIMLLTAACEVVVHTCFQGCEWSELTNESNEDKSKEEGTETKELFAFHHKNEILNCISDGYNRREKIQFNINSTFNQVHTSLPELPPEL